MWRRMKNNPSMVDVQLNSIYPKSANVSNSFKMWIVYVYTYVQYVYVLYVCADDNWINDGARMEQIEEIQTHKQRWCDVQRIGKIFADKWYHCSISCWHFYATIDIGASKVLMKQMTTPICNCICLVRKYSFISGEFFSNANESEMLVRIIHWNSVWLGSLLGPSFFNTF